MKLAETKIEFDVNEAGEPVGEGGVPPELFPGEVSQMLEEQKSCRIRLTVIVEKVEAE